MLRKIFYAQVLRQDISWYDQNEENDLTSKLSEYVAMYFKNDKTAFIFITYFWKKTILFFILFFLQ